MSTLKTKEVVEAWEKWLSVTTDRCHFRYALEGGSLDTHFDVCMKAGDFAANRIKTDVGAGLKPKRILEVGASVGWNCLGLCALYPDAEVHSVEPDKEAVQVAEQMATAIGANYHPKAGVGERLPYPDGHFDLIICHTVIEHVGNVTEVLQEMARVLSPRGALHLEAPNYVWPHEPHLDIWTIPKFGKGFVRATAYLQGKSEHVEYLGHLQFVTPFQLERFFRQNKMTWENRAARKIYSAMDGSANVVHYKRLGAALRTIGKLGLGGMFAWTIVKLGLYSSVLYTVRHVETNG